MQFDQSRVEQYLEWDDRFTVASRHWIAALAGAEVPGEYAPQSEARTRPMLAELNAALNSRNFLVGVRGESCCCGCGCYHCCAIWHVSTMLTLLLLQTRLFPGFSR